MASDDGYGKSDRYTWGYSLLSKTILCCTALGLILLTGIPAAAPLAQVPDSALTSVQTPECIPTFESIGILIRYTGDANRNSTYSLKYRKTGDVKWLTAHKMDQLVVGNRYSANLVNLLPNTSYSMEFTFNDPDGGSHLKNITCVTRSEVFPTGKKTTVSSRNKQLVISQSGTPTAYHVVESPAGQTATIDVGKKARACVVVDADYVIVRGLRLLNSMNHGITISPQRRHIVIEECEISQWGPPGPMGSYGYGSGSGIYYNEGEHFKGGPFVIQHNRIHTPTGGATQQQGPQGITIIGGAGNHVLRYNHIKGTVQAPLYGMASTQMHEANRSTDIYGNLFEEGYKGLSLTAYCWGTRVWGNVFSGVGDLFITKTKIPYIDFQGQLYVWRNLFWNVRRPNGKGGTMITPQGPGLFYFYNNTAVHVPGQTTRAGMCINTTQMNNFTALNNVIDCEVPYSNSINPAASNPPIISVFEHNLYRQTRTQLPLKPIWEAKGFFSASPAYEKDPNTYNIYLNANSPGKDGGTTITNFVESFTGSAPDLGACERGSYELKVGPHGSLVPPLILPRAAGLSGRHGRPQLRLITHRGECTKLHFCIQKAGPVRIRSYQANGRLYFSWDANHREPGWHRLMLASSQGGVAPLFFRIQTNSGTATTRHLFSR